MYRIGEDVQLAQELLGLDIRRLATGFGIGSATLSRWVRDGVVDGARVLEKYYASAYDAGIRYNQIKSQLYRDDCPHGCKVLFHGSKSGLSGVVDPSRSRANNDMGNGFYCGETLEQAAMFVANYPDSSVYMVELDDRGLRRETFGVDLDWMLTVALCRGRLKCYEHHKRLNELGNRLACSDVVIAPIADNRMYEIINDFCEGEITDVQCMHALSATDLGMQYVIKTERAAKALTILEQCYLCEPEKASYLERSREFATVGLDKVKAARRKYRGLGHYIEVIFA